jgi:hypothetical protein
MEQLVWWIFLGEIANEKAQITWNYGDRDKKSPNSENTSCIPNYVIERPDNGVNGKLLATKHMS